LLSRKLQSINLTRFSLALVGLMWVFPFLHYRHQYPLTTFDQEWWSALLGVLAAGLLLTKDYWQTPTIPRIVQLPAALIALVLLQWKLGKIAYFDQALLYVLYMLFVLLLTMLGARLRELLGLNALAVFLAICLLAGAELNALIGVLQHWHVYAGSWVVVSTGSIYGNLAQPNHFANYIALGLISLGLLYQLRKLPVIYVALLSLPLLFVLMLSGSRSSWLYLLLMAGLSWWSSRRQPELRRLLHYSLALLAGFALLHGLMQFDTSSVTTLRRMSGTDALGGIRLYLWREGWLIFSQSPLLGSGFGQFAWQHFQLGPQLQRAELPGLYNNAHNLIFQFAAEAGIAGLAVLFAALGVWMYGLRRATLDVAHWWGYAVLGVLGIHSLLEYPLWYSYFLAIAAILLGALDETRYALELRHAGRFSLAATLLLGLLSLLNLHADYQRLKTALTIQTGTVAERFSQARNGLVTVQNGTLLSPYAELFMSHYIEVNQDKVTDKLRLSTRVARYMPIGPVVYRQAYLLAEDGQVEPARQMLEKAIWSYPDDVNSRQQLVKLADKDPAHFAALLEFALKIEQEYARAIHKQ